MDIKIRLGRKMIYVQNQNNIKYSFKYLQYTRYQARCFRYFFYSIFSIPSSKFCKTGFNTSIIPVRKPRIQKFKQLGEGCNATKRQAELTPCLSDLNEAGPQSSPHSLLTSSQSSTVMMETPHIHHVCGINKRMVNL